MGTVYVIACFACIIGGFVAFALGSFGITSYWIRHRLPVKSPISLMNLGGVILFIGTVFLLMIGLFQWFE